MTKRRLGRSELYIEPLVLGTNVVGWTADEKTSFDIFDAALAEGFNAIDTADSYSRWIPGNDSESEKIIGRWMKARGNRDKVLVFTKVGSDMGQGHRDLTAKYIEQAVEASLKRLQTDYIDLYQSHWPDPRTPQEETLKAHDKLIKAGKVRFIGTSNHDEALLTEALEISKRLGIARYETVQNEFNLYNRDKFEGAVQDICVREEVSGWRRGSSPARTARPRMRGRARAARARWRNTSTRAASRSSRRWTRWRSEPAPRMPRSRSPGWRHSRASPRPSHPRARSSRCRA